jgi:hypothetical protein
MPEAEAQLELNPINRMVLLGASNVARAFPCLVEVASQLSGRRLEILAALGHGRSYGMRSRFLLRELPGIVECGLWSELDRRPTAPTAALVTDVGNDLLYGVPVPQIASWVESCLDRLRSAGARIVLTALPLCTIERISPKQYLMLRSILIPRCRLPRDTVLDRARQLDRRLRDMAHKHEIALVEHRPEWYGFDPIHLRRRSFPTAWPEILSVWVNRAPPSAATLLSLWHRLRLRLLPPERRWLLGRERYCMQPAGRLPNGTTIALY